MIDVSDGLLADLGHIADASGVAIDVRAAALDTAALEQPPARWPPPRWGPPRRRFWAGRSGPPRRGRRAGPSLREPVRFRAGGPPLGAAGPEPGGHAGAPRLVTSAQPP